MNDLLGGDLVPVVAAPQLSDLVAPPSPDKTRARDHEAVVQTTYNTQIRATDRPQQERDVQ